MFIRYASAKIVSVGPLKDLTPSFGRERLASLSARLASTDPVLLNPDRFTYLRIRAVSDGEIHGDNDNGDFFPGAELEERHSTFVHDPQYIDHDNKDAKRAIGIIVASIHHPGPAPGGWVEIISAIDKDRASKVPVPHLAGCANLLEGILEGRITDTSMGCFVDWSECNICGNKAKEEHEYCGHIANRKGQTVDTPDGPKRVCEINHGITFFEDSVITTTVAQGGGGADFDAKILSRVEAFRDNDWTSLIVDRRKLAAQRESKMDEIRTAGTDFDKSETHVLPAENMAMKHKEFEDYMTPDAPDKDKAYRKQMKQTSDPSLPLADMPADRNSVKVNADDYTQAKRKVAEADPSNPFGGKPDGVADAEDEMQEAKQEMKEERDNTPEDASGGVPDAPASDAPPAKDDKAPPPPPPTASRSWARRILESVSSVVGWNVKADRRDGEGVLAMQDFVSDRVAAHKAATAKAHEVVSESRRKALLADASAASRDVQVGLAIIARASVDPRFANALNTRIAEGGNPQELVDGPSYDENVFGKTEKQIGKSSDKVEGPQRIQRPGNVSINEKAADYPQKGGQKLSGRPMKTASGQTLTPVQADRAIDMIVQGLSMGKSYEDAERVAIAAVLKNPPVQAAKKAASISCDACQKDLTAAPIRVAGTLLCRACAIQDRQKNGDVSRAARIAKVKRAMASMKSKADGGWVGNSPAESKAHKPEKVASDAPPPGADDKGEEETPFDDKAMARRKMAAEESDGNAKTLKSPSTEEISNDGNEKRAEKFEMQSKGNNAPPVSEVLSAAVMNRMAMQTAELRRRNRVQAKQLAQYAMNERNQQAMRVAGMMLEKGMFASKGNINLQRQAAQAEAKRLAAAPVAVLKEAERNVKMVSGGSTVPQWKRTVEFPREGAVRRPVTSSASRNEPDADLRGVWS